MAVKTFVVKSVGPQDYFSVYEIKDLVAGAPLEAHLDIEIRDDGYFLEVSWEENKADPRD